MISLLLAWQIATAPAVSYHHVPARVVRAIVVEWRDNRSPLPVASAFDRQDDGVTVRAVAGQRCLVMLERADGAYLLDGPFWWPSEDVTRVVDDRWRRTIPVAAIEPLLLPSALEWLSADPSSSTGWPRCLPATDRRWSCLGAALGDTGVFVCRAADRVWWSVLASTGATTLRPSRWARLLTVRDPSGESAGLRVQIARAAPPLPQRFKNVRLDTTTVAGARVTGVGAGTAWVSGDEVPAKAWVEVRTRTGGPSYLPLEDVADGPPSLPLAVRLEETRAFDGLVVGGGEEPAGHALVTLFRLIDPPRLPAGPAHDKPRRVLAGELTTDARGAFHLDGAGDADYEVVAWHAQLGRASLPLPRNAAPLLVRLASPGLIRGRVLGGGKPLAGVDVVSLPGLDAYASAEDLMDVKGGDAHSGVDGRFAVMAAAGGGGELRVGGGTHPIKRIPLPRVLTPLLDLGNIELGLPLELTIVLEQDSDCEVRGTGPVGQTGLQIVTARRTGQGLYRMTLPEAGLWEFGLFCGREEHGLLPSVVQLGSAQSGQEVRFAIR